MFSQQNQVRIFTIVIAFCPLTNSAKQLTLKLTHETCLWPVLSYTKISHVANPLFFLARWPEFIWFFKHFFLHSFFGGAFMIVFHSWFVHFTLFAIITLSTKFILLACGFLSDIFGPSIKRIHLTSLKFLSENPFMVNWINHHAAIVLFPFPKLPANEMPFTAYLY